MQCNDFREVADSYMCDELLIETNHQVIAHLEACADCRRELGARRELRAKLRAAFLGAPEGQMTPDFAGRLRTQLRDYETQRSTRSALRGEWRSATTLRRASWFALAACCLVAAGFGLVRVRDRIFQRQLETSRPETQKNSQVATESPAYSPAEMNPGLHAEVVKTSMARSAAGDHRNCAINFRLPEKPIDLEEAGRIYDPVYLNLTKAVLTPADGELARAQLVEAHSCIFEGRRFAHIVLRYRGRLVSFLVTESDRANETQATATQTHTDPTTQVIACSEFEGYQVSCFATGRHAVFVVSDLPEAENLAFARSIAPRVSAHITRVENAA